MQSREAVSMHSCCILLRLAESDVLLIHFLIIKFQQLSNTCHKFISYLCFLLHGTSQLQQLLLKIVFQDQELPASELNGYILKR